MRSADYVIKRVFFAIVTVFVAITLNFVLFRAVPGDAVDALRCRQCSAEFKEIQRQELGLDKSKWEQYRLYLAGLAPRRSRQVAPDAEGGPTELWEPLKNTMPMVALGTLFAIVFGTLTGVISAWRRDTVVDKGGLWTSLAFYSMPTQWLGLLIVLFVAGAVGLPTSGIEDPTLGVLGDASTGGTSSSIASGT